MTVGINRDLRVRLEFEPALFAAAILRFYPPIRYSLTNYHDGWVVLRHVILFVKKPFTTTDAAVKEPGSIALAIIREGVEGIGRSKEITLHLSTYAHRITEDDLASSLDNLIASDRDHAVATLHCCNDRGAGPWFR